MSAVSRKIILLGHFSVGKTSLTRRFVHSIFNERYLTTIGVNIEKKSVDIDGRTLNMIIWDIAGERNMDWINPSYILGAAGGIYVFDVNRPETYKDLEAAVAKIKRIVPNLKLKIVGNKKDLLTEDELENIKQTCNMPIDAFSSALTGEHVEEVFHDLAKEVIG